MKCRACNAGAPPLLACSMNSGTEDCAGSRSGFSELAEQQKIADGIRAAVTRGSAVALRYVHLLGSMAG